MVKELLDPKKKLVELGDPSKAKEEGISIDVKETPRITFHDSYLLLRFMVHNMPLCILVCFGKFWVARIVIDPNTSITIMRLTMLLYLQLSTSMLKFK